MSTLPSIHRKFILTAKTYDLLVAATPNSLQIVLILGQQLAIYQELFTSNNFTAIQGPNFKHIDEVYTFLDTMKATPTAWQILEPGLLQIVKSQNETVRISLRLVSDPF